MTSTSDESWLAGWFDLVGLTVAFRRSCLLFAAIELNLFEPLTEKAASAEELSEIVGVELKPITVFLKALVAIGVLTMVEDRFAIARQYRQLLLAGPMSAEADIRRYIRENRVWLDAAAIVRGDQRAPIEYERELLDSKIQDFPALARFNRIMAQDVIDAISGHICSATRILDMGGGDGVFADLILRMNANARVDVLELEGGAKACHTKLGNDIKSGRLRVVYGDARDYRSGEKMDLVIINELLELYTTDDKERIVRSAARCLNQNGKVALIKFSLDPGGLFPPMSAMFSVRMLLKAGSYLETDAEVATLFSRAGCTQIKQHNLNGMKTVFVAGQP